MMLKIIFSFFILYIGHKSLNTSYLYMKQYKWLLNLEDTEDNPLTRDRILNWMIDTGYIDGLVRKRTSPLDYPHLEDFTQSCWEEICKIPEEKLLEIYRKGKGKFTSYIKSLIGHQVYSSCSKTFKENKAVYYTEVYLTDEQWDGFIENGETDFDQQFPQIRRDGDLGKRVVFEYDKGYITAELNLYE